jgi:hypothetical protein
LIGQGIAEKDAKRAILKLKNISSYKVLHPIEGFEKAQDVPRVGRRIGLALGTDR